MAIDSKFLKIGILATTAIVAPAVTIAVQQELDDFEYEGYVEEAEFEKVEEATQLSTEPQAEVKKEPPVEPKEEFTFITDSKGKKRKIFASKRACLKVFNKCKKYRRKETAKPK